MVRREPSIVVSDTTTKHLKGGADQQPSRRFPSGRSCITAVRRPRSAKIHPCYQPVGNDDISSRKRLEGNDLLESSRTNKKSACKCSLLTKGRGNYVLILCDLHAQEEHETDQWQEQERAGTTALLGCKDTRWTTRAPTLSQVSSPRETVLSTAFRPLSNQGRLMDTTSPQQKMSSKSRKKQSFATGESETVASPRQTAGLWSGEH